MSDRVQPRRRPTLGEERFSRPRHARFGAEGFEDRRAEERVAEICDGILRRLAELQSGETETGLPGRKRRRPD
ncbi:MAG: hypothetical protein WB661_13150 [Candidatus Bathyarchaeia archaeon]